jgi:ribonuclease P protein component
MTKPRAQPLGASSDDALNDNTVADDVRRERPAQHSVSRDEKTPSQTVNSTPGFTPLPCSSLKLDRDFRRVRNKGKPGRTALMTLRWMPQRRPEVQCGIVVSKKVGNAVVRNKVRRRLREIVRRMDWPAMQAMIIVSPEAAKASYADLVKALRVAATKSGLR